MKVLQHCVLAMSLSLLLSGAAAADEPLTVGLGVHPRQQIQGESLFRVEHEGLIEVTIRFEHERSDLDLVVLDAAGTPVAESAGTSDSEMVTLWYRPGMVIRVYQYETNEPSEFDLRLRAIDIMEAEVGGLYPDLEVGGMADAWISCELRGPTTIALRFSHEDGDIDVSVFSPDMDTLTSATSSDDDELLFLDHVGPVFIRAYLFSGVDAEARNRFTLQITDGGEPMSAGEEYPVEEMPAPDFSDMPVNPAIAGLTVGDFALFEYTTELGGGSTDRYQVRYQVLLVDEPGERLQVRVTTQYGEDRFDEHIELSFRTPAADWLPEGLSAGDMGYDRVGQEALTVGERTFDCRVIVDETMESRMLISDELGFNSGIVRLEAPGYKVELKQLGHE